MFKTPIWNVWKMSNNLLKRGLNLIPATFACSLGLRNVRETHKTPSSARLFKTEVNTYLFFSSFFMSYKKKKVWFRCCKLGFQNKKIKCNSSQILKWRNHIKAKFYGIDKKKG